MKIEKRYLETFRGIDGTNRRIPYLKISSGNNGPTVWITAAIHGDEVTGTAVVQSLIKFFQQNQLTAGILYLVPILNPSGFEAISRREQYAEADLNRNFGGKRDGTPSERLAWKILDEVIATKPSFVLDLHTDSMNSIAYTIVDGFHETSLLPIVTKSVTLAQKIGFAFGIDSHIAAGYHMSKSFSGQLITNGIPSITIELGGPLVVNNQMRIDGIEAIFNVLSWKKMIAKTIKQTVIDHGQDTQLRYFLPRINTQSTGIIEYRVEPGNLVTKGAILGKIRDVFARTIEIIKAPEDCMVFSHVDQSVTFPGLDLFTLTGTNKV